MTNQRTCLTERQHGATLVEFVIVVPVLLLIIFLIIQFALLSHAKSQVYYATYEAARAGTAYNAQTIPNPGCSGCEASAEEAFKRAIIGYYGGGNTSQEIQEATNRMKRDIGQALELDVEVFGEYEHYMRVTAVYGIPEFLQVPFAGKIILEVLEHYGLEGKAGNMVNKGRIPIKTEVVMHVQPQNMEKAPWVIRAEKAEEEANAPFDFDFDFSNLDF